MKKLLAFVLVLMTLVSSTALFALAEEPLQLTMYFPVNVGGDAAKLIDQMTADFNAENPDVQVQAVYTGNYDDTVTAIQTAIQGGNAPDLFVSLATQRFTMADTKMAMPLDDLIAADPEGQAFVDDFIDGFMLDSYVDGSIYSIPFQRSTIIMYYNKDAFRAAGLDPETPPTTWEELADYAQKLTVRDENGNVTQWGVQISTNDPFMFSPFALQNSENGENLMTSDGKTALFDTEGNAEALQFLVDLSQKYQAMPEGVIVWADSTSNFMAGTAAMLYMSSGSLTNVLKNTDFEVGTCFLPAGKRYGSATGGANFYIFDGISEEKLAATWKFIRWITEPERAAQWSIDTGYVATRKSCFELDVLKDYFATVPQAATAGDQLQYAGSELMLYDNTRCWDILKNAIDAAMTLTMTPQEALAQAQAEVDQVLADYQ